MPAAYPTYSIIEFIINIATTMASNPALSEYEIHYWSSRQKFVITVTRFQGTKLARNVVEVWVRRVLGTSQEAVHVRR